MKKIILCLAFLILLIPNVYAMEVDYTEYEKLDIAHSFVVGDYIFDASYGYTPSLKDFMHASRTIPENREVYVYEIFIVKIPQINYRSFSMTEVYSKQKTTDTKDFINFRAKYVYRTNIDKATSNDYTVLD